MNYKILSVVTLLIAVVPTVVLAQTPTGFIPLVGVPGLEANNMNIGTYINALYTLSISIAALLAVIKIIIAGVKYMLSDVVTSKADAKSDIQGALVGLLVVISAVIILETINPQLRVFRLVMEPASQPPGRAVQTAPTSNGSEPLPGVNTSVGRESLDCTQNSAGVANCTEAANTCYSRNGRLEQSIRSNTQSITCLYGESVTVYCEQEMNSATQQMEADCTSAQAQCPSGSQYTQTSEYRGSCYTPFPPRPQADDRGTRGGQ